MARSNAAFAGRGEVTLESLEEAHQNLKRRLNELDKHRSLSPEEQFEVQVIKKRKLALKDRILSMQARN